MVRRFVFNTFLFWCGTACGQSVSFKFQEGNGKSVRLVYIKVYCDSGRSSMIDYKLERESFYIFKIKHQCPTYYFTFNASGYHEEIWHASSDSFNRDTSITIEFYKTNVKQLAPVIIEAAKKPIIVTGDTTVYNIPSFLNGSERKLEDVLKKLPGIEVNDKTGEIKFKGRPIETVLLEGDNLFGQNYTLGTKNIDVAMVIEVQAIENFNENYVLKGLESENRVALNLKLKNTKLKITGNAEIEAGINSNGTELLDVAANAIGLQTRMKFFSTISFNNNAINRTPFMIYGGNSLSLEQAKDKAFLAQQFIQDPGLNYLPAAFRVNKNNLFFCNYNGIMRFNRIGVRINAYYMNDKIENNYNNKIVYKTNLNTIETNDDVEIKRSPELLQSNIYVRNEISSDKLSEYKSSIQKNHTQSSSLNSTNFNPSLKILLQTNSIINKNEWKYTIKAGTLKAIQYSIINFNSHILQNFTISPSVVRRANALNDWQNVVSDKYYVQAQAALIGKTSNSKYNFLIRGIYDNSQFHSLLAHDSADVKLFTNRNNIDYKKIIIEQKGLWSRRFDRLIVEPNYSISLIHQQLLNKTTATDTSAINLLFQPNIKLRWMVSKWSSLTASYGISSRPKVENYLSLQPVLTSHRNAISNIPNLGIINTQTLQLYYNYSDLYNQFDNSISLLLQRSNKDYMSSYLITDSLFYLLNFLKNLRTQGLDVYANSTKYFPFMLSSFSVHLSFSLSQFYNFVNTSEVRNNKNYTYLGSIFYKTVFKGVVNVENEFSYMFNQSKSEKFPANSFSSFENKGKIILKPLKDWKVVGQSNFIVPNAKTKQKSHFIDILLSYVPMNKRFNLSFAARNLLNNNRYIVNQLSDFSHTIFSAELLPRSFSVSVAVQL